jgi:hypothetical protein
MTRWTLSGGALVAPGRAPLPYVPSGDGFVLGVTEPTWANSGCRIPTASLTRNETTRITTTADGQVIEGLHLPYGQIVVSHQNVTIRDCLINIGNGQARGLADTGANWAISGAYGVNTSGLRIEHVTVDPVNAGLNGAADGPRIYGIATAYAATYYRCAIRRVTDALNPDGNNVNIIGCYLATRYLSYDPVQTDGTHNDGIQIATGGPINIIGNAIHNFDGEDGVGMTTYLKKGQGVVITPWKQPYAHHINVERNWFYGAFTQVSAWPRYNEGGPGIQSMRIVGNRHGGPTYNPIFITPTTATMGVVTGNVAAASGLTHNTTPVAAGSAVNATVSANTQGTGVPA